MLIQWMNCVTDTARASKFQELAKRAYDQTVERIEEQAEYQSKSTDEEKMSLY